MRLRALTHKKRLIVVALALAALTITSPGSQDLSATTRIIGTDHLVSSTPLPDEPGETCPMPDMETSYQQRGGAAAAPATPSYSMPVRVVRDRYPSFSSIAVDLARDQIVVTDENLFQVLFYDRTENNGPNQVA